MNGEIKHLYVTLKRSFAGTRESHVNILKSLGLRKREQSIQKANTAAARGAIDKVSALPACVETDVTALCQTFLRCPGQAPGPG